MEAARQGGVCVARWVVRVSFPEGQESANQLMVQVNSVYKLKIERLIHGKWRSQQAWEWRPGRSNYDCAVLEGKLYVVGRLDDNCG